MASLERYRPPREGYQPPTLPPKPTRQSRSPSNRRDIPPAAPSPPAQSSRASPPNSQPRRRAPSSSAESSPRSPSRPRLSQWFFTQNEAMSSPSMIDGLPPAEERLRRAKGVNFIHQAGVLLDIPQISLWVAGVFFHRFYMRYSMCEEKGGIHHYNIAATALFLANKTEENCRKTKDLIIAVAKVAQKNPKLIIDEQSKEYWRWRDSILTYEELMLEALTFDLMVDTPYQRLYECLQELDMIHHKRMREAAWAFINDSCHTVLPLLMDGRDIAISSIFFGTHLTDEKIDDKDGEPWWRVLEGNEERITTAMHLVIDFYTENPLRKREGRYQGSPIFSLDNSRRRGEIPSQPGSQNGTPLGPDRAIQSPLAQSQSKAENIDGPNGQGESQKIDGDGSQSTGAAGPSQPRGYLNGAPKAVANGPDYKENPNGNGIRSPKTKRTSLEADLDPQAERDQKRARLSDEDEGEVQES